LQSWNRKWKSHSHATAHPFDYRHGPLLADCIPLLLTAYYHTYVSKRLKALKASLNIPSASAIPFGQGQTHIDNAEGAHEFSDGIDSIPIADLEKILTTQSEEEWDYLSRAAKLAASSLLLRAKLGFRYVARTAPLDMGFHYVSAGFEGALILSCWIYAANKQGRYDTATRALQSLIDGIIDEMDDMILVKGRPAIAPLAGIRSMMECGWIWAFAHTNARQLQLQESRLITILAEKI